MSGSRCKKLRARFFEKTGRYPRRCRRQENANRGRRFWGRWKGELIAISEWRQLKKRWLKEGRAA